MTRRHGLCTLAVSILALSGCSPGGSSPPAPGVGDSPTSPPQTERAAITALDAPTFTIRIPIALIDAGNPPEGALTMRAAAEDREPEGPQSFDVLDDGGFLIADPLRERLLEYSADGTFRRAVPIDVPASSVTVIGASQVEVVSAATGVIQMFNERGGRVGGPRTESAISGAGAPDVVLDSAQSGVITWPNAPGALAPPRPELKVTLPELGQRLASLQVIQSDAADEVFVAMESTDAAGRTLIELRKTVRRYGATGLLEAEIRNIAVDNYIAPNTEFRVLRGVLYQMYSREKEVLINGWRIR